jgi:HK97 family phage portal protein
MPTLLTKSIRTIVNQVQKASRGTLSSYVLNAPPEYGQPLPLAADPAGLITMERMREVALKTATVAACVNTILDFSDNVPPVLAHRDPSKKVDPQRKDYLDDLLNRPNPNDTFLQFFHQIRHDLTVLGMAAVEIERDVNGNVANLWVMDMARIRIDYDEHGTLLGYDEIDARGMPVKGPDGVHGWLPEDVILFRRDPISSSLYGNSRLTQLFVCAVIEDLMLHFIGTRFTDSNIPFGVMDLGDISEDELQFAINSWNSQALKQHRILLTGSKGAKWYPFGYHLKDLEAVQLLLEVRRKIMSILGVTENELGESSDVNKSNGYNLSYTFKKRAIEPPTREICGTLSRRLLWDELGWIDLQYTFDEIDSRDELVQAEIDKSYLQTGIYTFNHVANRKGLPSIAGGDTRMVFTGSAWLPVKDLAAFSDAQLAALQAVVQSAADDGEGGQGSSSVSPPLIRAPAMPEKFTTPDGSGSSTVKVRYPTKKENGGRARGNVQTMRNQGLRKEDTR